MQAILFRWAVRAAAGLLYLGLTAAAAQTAGATGVATVGAMGAVTGVVTDDAGTPLAGATVVLRDEAGGLQRYGAATDAVGRFALTAVRPGRYRLVVSYVGFGEHVRGLVVTEGETADVRVRLAALAVPGQEVVVTATRGRTQLTPITFSNLTARELEEQPAMKDLPVLLSTLPSITYVSENGNGIGYATLRLRGFDEQRVAVSINGIPQNDPEEHRIFWINFFDLQGAIQDVQVQRGAGSAFYGSTGIGGAVNIVAMPYKPHPYARVEVGYGAYDTQRYTAEANTGLLGGRYVAYGRFSRLLTDGYRDWSWSRFYRFFAGVTRYGERSTLTLQAYGGPQRDGLAYSGIPKAANDAAVPDGFGGTVDRRSNPSALTRDVEYFHQPHVELLHDWQPAPNLHVHQALFAVKGEGYFDFGGTFRSPDYLRLPQGFGGLTAEERALPLYATMPDVSLLFRAYLDQWHAGWLPRLSVRHRLGETRLGAEARLHRSLRWGRIQEATGIPAERVGADADVRVYSFRGEKAVASLTASHLARPHERLAVQADVQLTYQHYRTFDDVFFGYAFKVPYVFLNPRLGVTLNPERPLSAYASVAYAGREPRMKSLYDGEEAGAGFVPRFARRADGSFDYDAPLVSPEHLLDLELGAAFSQPRYRAAATAFFMDFHDEIVPSGGLDQFGTPRSGNADRTRHLGLELEAAARLLRGLDVYANATLSRNRILRFTEYVTLPDFSVAAVEQDGNPIAGFPDRIANVGVRYRRAGFTAGLDAKYAGRQYVDNSGGRDPDGTPNPGLEVPPYTLLNATLQYAFPAASAFGGLRLAFDVNNVLDEKVLLYGNVGFGAPQFFPAATRHVFFSARYTL